MSVGFLPPPGALTVETSKLIAAPIADVWAILIGFDAYGEWNTQIPRIDGVAAAGSIIVLWPANEGEKTVRVEALEPYRMHWVGSAENPADFRGDHYFGLEPVGASNTLLVHREFFSGRFAATILAAYGEMIRASFEGFNRSLQAVAEQRRDG
ncbi:SRPBCC domain-containing protein [Sphingopyxis sp.]|uniref:SRPBCC domain-containing protein n=1 Tax=Sphingopyxis sp. TaxID=1908224 RepID=UPI002ED91628